MAEVRLDHVQLPAAGQQVGEFLLKSQRVEPVGGDAADDGGDRAGPQSSGDSAPSATETPTLTVTLP